MAKGMLAYGKSPIMNAAKSSTRKAMDNVKSIASKMGPVVCPTCGQKVKK